MSQDILPLPTHPDCLGSESANTHRKLTGYTGQPHADTHPAVPLRVAPGLLFLGGPHPLCSFTLYFNPPTEAQKHMILAPGWHFQFLRSQVSQGWFVLCILLGAAVYREKQTRPLLLPGMKPQ